MDSQCRLFFFQVSPWFQAMEAMEVVPLNSIFTILHHSPPGVAPTSCFTVPVSFRQRPRPTRRRRSDRGRSTAHRKPMTASLAQLNFLDLEACRFTQVLFLWGVETYVCISIFYVRFNMAAGILGVCICAALEIEIFA